MQSVSAALTAENLPIAPRHKQTGSPRRQYLGLRCPVCKENLCELTCHALGKEHEPLECAECGAVLKQAEGIWEALPENRHTYFDRFIHDYEAIRKAEGRGSEDAAFYLALPFQDLTRRNSWQWMIRARTYKYLAQQIIPAIDENRTHPLSILDLGAGNCWLSYRLAGQGHRPIAVDLQTNPLDGLGASIHYRHSLPALFPRVQAELDRLPFTDGQFDCAIFNASFHYSENYDHTLAEAVRCVREGGTIVIADSPTYSTEESGRKMVEERRQLFKERFGFTSDGLSRCEYLTEERLLALEARHDVRWTTHKAWYGLGWACRPLVARLKRRREPSQFRIYTAQVKVT
jgi:SAM-dependent methyltransferase